MLTTEYRPVAKVLIVTRNGDLARTEVLAFGSEDHLQRYSRGLPRHATAIEVATLADLRQVPKATMLVLYRRATGLPATGLTQRHIARELFARLLQMARKIPYQPKDTEMDDDATQGEFALDAPAAAPKKPAAKPDARPKTITEKRVALPSVLAKKKAALKKLAIAGKKMAARRTLAKRKWAAAGKKTAARVKTTEKRWAAAAKKTAAQQAATRKKWAAAEKIAVEKMTAAEKRLTAAEEAFAARKAATEAKWAE